MPIFFAASAASLSIIRLALLAGTTMFGAMAWFLAGGTGLAPDLVAELPYAPVALTVLFAALAVGVWIVRAQRRATGGSPIVGWALAESMALIGGVYLLLAGDPAFLVVGLAAQLFVSFVAMPVSPQ
ncbi:hypothetical protein CRI93_06090 [Longimonas halophila]|uniref:Uncharacterized protein n=1 Tax=Longimonas halophila TaxID=1469170 RepID=A0A2H3NMV8_9BACT|nr:hypothetical protein [Longimonas halophila]PEN08010.1 hypothetical protein CRI93_06090 [Longimonas halophila]